MTDGAIYQVKLRRRGVTDQLYVVAPNELEAERMAWQKLETITGATYTGFRCAVVSIVKGIGDNGETQRRLQDGRR